MNRRRTNRSLFLVAVLASLFAGRAVATTPLSVLDPAWNDAIEFLSTRGAFPGLFGTTRPYPREEVRDALETARRTASTSFERSLAERALREITDPPDRRFRVRGWAELRFTPEWKPRALPALRAALRYDGPKGTTLYQEFEIAPATGRYRVVPGGATAQQRVRPWNPRDLFPDGGYVADFTRALVRVPIAGLALVVGRQSVRWGPGVTGTLLLSDASPALDGVRVEGTFGDVRGVALFATLNRMWHDERGRRYLARRYFAAHRVHWRPSETFEVGIMDSVLYGGDARPVEPYYANPLLPFYASQYNASTPSDPDFLDDNVAIGFDVRWRPRPGWALYGELLIDDFRYDPASNDPNALAWLVGLHRAGFRERGEARIEYARVGRYTYTHLVQELQYTHFGAPLGDRNGNDADRLLAEVAWWPSPSARLFARLEGSRKGDSGVDDRFRGEKDTGFLKGIAEIRRGLVLGGWGDLRRNWRIEGSLAIVHVRGRDHQPDENVMLWEWRGAIAYRFDLR